MISLILPYWQRLEAARASLRRMAALYEGLDLEVIVVDDGSPEAFVTPEGMPWPVRVFRMPAKTGPLNPCLPFNWGAFIARGDVIALSNPENLHRGPVLTAMLDELERGHRNSYVMAAAWHVEGGHWHCHSSLTGLTVEGVKLPQGAHYHFLAMMRRELFDRAGGFDNDYRDGAGYDDPDFVMRVARAGAQFVMRDDLIVDHIRTQARARWTPAMFERNRKLFVNKWRT
jgi:GT2 family glycosyltransferase